MHGSSYQGDGQRALPVHECPRIAASHIPHRDEQHAISVAGFEHRDDVRIIHGRRGPGFTDEAMPEGLIRRQGGREDLERYRPPEPLVLGPEHHRRRALACLRVRDLRLEALAGPLPRDQREQVTQLILRPNKTYGLAPAEVWRLSARGQR